MNFSCWPLIALIYSFVAAGYVMTNDVFRQDGVVAVFWRSLFAAAFLLPLALLVKWPHDPHFYMLVFSSAAISAVGDMYMFQSFKQYGGSVMSRMAGLRPVIIFLVWPLFYPQAFDVFVRSPLLAVGIALCLATIALAMFLARHNHLSRSAFISYLPPLFLFSLGDILTKFSVPLGSGLDRMLVLCFLCASVMTVVTGIRLRFYGRKTIIVPERVWQAGVINALLFIGIVTLKAYGLSLTPDPSYFNALAMIFTVWTYLAHRFIFKREDKASPVAGFVVVASAAALTVLVEMLPK